MSTTHLPTRLELARYGFADLSAAQAQMARLATQVGLQDPECDPECVTAELIEGFSAAPDADQALASFLRLSEIHPEAMAHVRASSGALANLILLLGASNGFEGFFTRNPDELAQLPDTCDELPDADTLLADMLASVGAEGPDGFSLTAPEEGIRRLRQRYRHWLSRITIYDLRAESAVEVQPRVSAALADLAAAAVAASLACARTAVTQGMHKAPEAHVRATAFTVIGMGKTGARELNYVSDVDMIFVAQSNDHDVIGDERAVQIGTQLATHTMRGLDSFGIEPPLWQTDANLRPEGKDGALVRTLNSHVTYYERWAKSWEFQALLKARPIAGDAALGAAYRERIDPFVWASAARDHFVESVQKMRERVTDHIPDDEVDRQVKLGPGGIRDVEFTVQLLQLVHGRLDDRVHAQDTLTALAQLRDAGYIGRAEADKFARDYRTLRVIEHRLQLRHLRRTHLMPTEEEELRVLARATGLAQTAAEIQQVWRATRRSVRQLYERIFYRPLLSAVAELSEDDFALTEAQAEARLAAIGFLDPRGALGHIRALTNGVSRKVKIQRHLLPVLLQWFAQGMFPDYALHTFRELSDRIGDAYWFLRMLRDSKAAAERLSRVLSSSKFVGQLLISQPEAALWLGDDKDLQPRDFPSLEGEIQALVTRHEDDNVPVAKTIMSIRRREVLRLAMSNVLGIFNAHEIGIALSHVTTATLRGMLGILRTRERYGVEFAIIAMGRYGGMELGFSSDADVIYVYRALPDTPAEEAAKGALTVARRIKELTTDLAFPLELDLDLRPEGKKGPIVRTLDAYRAYYQRWSATWEAQALLRANPVAGDQALLDDFAALIEPIRYPASLDVQEVREIRRIKARVESERLPRGADPKRHLKLGRGSLSDVEWLVQLLQLMHAHEVPELRTTGTMAALDVCVAQGYLTEEEGEKLRLAWRIASRVRSASTLALGKTVDVLPSDHQQLEAIARMLNGPKGSASWFENEYLAKTRRARQVFERRFYGTPEPYFSRPGR